MASRFIPSSLLAAAIVLLSGRGEAYEVKHTAGGNAVSWRARDVEWTVDASVRKVPGAEDAVIAAAAAWAGCGGAPALAVTHVGADLEPGLDQTNGVFFVESGFPPVGDALAVTVLSFDAETGQVLDADILLNGNYPLGIVTPPAAHPTSVEGAASVPVAAGATYDVARVLAHEMGHALALSDELADTSALMYPYVPRGVVLATSPAADDVAGLATLYEAPEAAAERAASNGSSASLATAACTVVAGPSAPDGSAATGLGAGLALAAVAALRARRSSQGGRVVRTIEALER